MGFMDQLKSMFGGAKKAASAHPDQVRQGMDKAEQAVNQQTGGKYGDQITKAGDAAEKALGVQGQPGQPGQPGQAAPGQPGPGQAPGDPQAPGQP